MVTNPRRERDRSQREQLIVTTAREIAEEEGWEAVTTRRLAAKIEYSQPVLYSHFSGKGAIMAAAALEGCTEMAADMRKGARAGEGSREALLRLAENYFDFADRKPALYDAIFTLASELSFASPDSPEPLKDAFGALLEVVGPVSGEDDPGLYTETFWAALHGLVTLERSRRLPADARTERIGMLVDRFAVGG
ncbi:DNA-binding transcriptional regulator, AcrR family [Amycolatopsis lurida]|uniref:TetR family transcriptional regulator n=1 Tax=Amycolatopsis lurida NRRL 2430 TaxID=1460371 RepID=A0A2P2FHG0_AMYLU|nr:TetR/AcrR family transcriptional regulator [Amycolatopsis lurida]KFU76170.1 TetR family transcriptional regulator [Amycolatopsis lurida NRRL 2430]SEE62472.1 DNA-binding transcriptional regulator, AcrR family [Amycolatopsis lurida]